ncbi:UDP-glucose 4-epimerase [Nitrobacteraceae bacterium AZCC 1564]
MINHAPLRKTVLLTGTTGFIGRHVARRLANVGARVISLQRSELCVPGVTETIQIAEFSAPHISDALQGRSFDWLIHLAAAGVSPFDRDIARLLSVNVDGTRALVVAAAGWPASAVFVAGSGSAYDLRNVDHPITELHRCETLNAYGASKAAASIMASAIAENLKLSLAVGHIFGVYGPGEPAHRLLPSLYNGLCRSERVSLSSGQQRRDMLFVDDLVDAIISATSYVDLNSVRLIANISTGAPITVREFAETVAETMNANKDLLGFGDIPTRPDEVKYFSGDHSLLTKLTGWRPSTNIQTGIKLSISAIAHDSVNATPHALVGLRPV